MLTKGVLGTMSRGKEPPRALLKCSIARQAQPPGDFMAQLSSARTLGLLASGLFALCLGAIAHADQTGHTLMRYPTLGGNTIVFVAHDNLWSVPRTGGTASRLTADEGRDVMPRFSPDGRWIAFTGEYQGNRDAYVIPAGGGPAKRLTFTSDIAPEVSPRSGP